MFSENCEEKLLLISSGNPFLIIEEKELCMSNRRLIRKEGPLFITLILEPKNSPNVTFLGRVGRKNKKLFSLGNCL